MASSKEHTRRRSAGLSVERVDMYGRRIKKVQYENTYRLEPTTLFPVEKATGIIKELVDDRLADKQYDPDKCMALCKSMAQEIRDHIKNLFVCTRFFPIEHIQFSQRVNSG